MGRSGGSAALQLLAEVTGDERRLAPKTLQLRELVVGVREWRVLQVLPDGSEVLAAAPVAWSDV